MRGAGFGCRTAGVTDRGFGRFVSKSGALQRRTLVWPGWSGRDPWRMEREVVQVSCFQRSGAIRVFPECRGGVGQNPGDVAVVGLRGVLRGCFSTAILRFARLTPGVRQTTLLNVCTCWPYGGKGRKVSPDAKGIETLSLLTQTSLACSYCRKVSPDAKGIETR